MRLHFVRVTEPLSDDERALIKEAAFGAVVLVANAEPGGLSLVRESFAAADAFAGATGLVGELLTTGEPPRVPPGEPAELERRVLDTVERAVTILRAKAPGELASFQDTVLTAALSAAGAAAGVSATESAAMAKIRSALGRAGGA